MSKATTVAVAGLGLMAVNAWTGPQRSALADVLNGKSGSQATGHNVFLELGGEGALIAVAAVAAGSSEQVGTGMIAAIVALWVLWALTHYAGGSAPSVGASPVQSSPKMAKAA